MIIGYEKEKKEIRKYGDMLLHAAEYESLGLRIPRGLIIHGPQGVGKSTLAGMIGGEGMDTVTVNVSEFSDEDMPGAIMTGMEKARGKGTSVLVLDELDRAFGAKTPFSDDGDEMRSFIQGLFEGMEDSDRILIVATCQDDSWADMSLRRSGRFEKSISMGLPDGKTRCEILEAYLGRISMERDFSLQEAGRLTAGYSGGDIEALANEIGLDVAMQGKSVMTLEAFNNVLNRQILGGENRPALCSEEKHRIAVHEAGHALTALRLDPDNLFGASIVPQGKSLGHIRYVEDERNTSNTAELEDSAVIMLGGHVAERVFLGGYLTGSSSDIGMAGKIVYGLVTREAAYGYDYVLLNQGRRFESLASDEVKAMASRMVSEKLSELDAKAESIMSENKDLYVRIVKALEEKETLTRQELLAMAS